MDTNLTYLFQQDDSLYLAREGDGRSAIPEKFYSTLTCISEKKSIYGAEVEIYNWKEDEQRLRSADAKLLVDPASLRDHLEPGTVGRINQDIESELEINGDRYSVDLNFPLEMSESVAETALVSDVMVPELAELVDESVKINASRKPIETVETTDHSKFV